MSVYRNQRPSFRREDWQRLPLHVKVVIAGSATIGGLYLASHVETMPHTGRRRLMLLSPAYEETLGAQAYHEILSRSRLLPPSHPVSLSLFRE
ncbi:hypothetical protein PsorP6_012154 [Peronosclerospora sorghi]|uniref:Uncharacterized protein n=1 Tax=Peronosclerospora sorghi TaxID=230839 RepID=A0ACC0WLW2_9STRA|nr:hypothetical protein PsorP6_012154 [Peronosclerospora sorghi]